MKPLALTVIVVVLMALVTSPVHAYFSTVVSSTQNQLSAGYLQMDLTAASASGSAQVSNRYQFWVAVQNEQSASSAAALPFKFRQSLSNGHWSSGPHLDGDVIEDPEGGNITCPASPAAADANLVTVQNVHRYAGQVCEGDTQCEALATQLAGQGGTGVPGLAAADHGQGTTLSGYYYGSTAGSQSGYPTDTDPISVAAGQFVIYRLEAVVDDSANDCYQGATFRFDWSAEAAQLNAPWATWQSYFYDQSTLSTLELTLPESEVAEVQALASGGRADQWPSVAEDLQLTSVEIPVGSGRARQARLGYRLKAARAMDRSHESAMMVFLDNQLIKEVWANDAGEGWQELKVDLPIDKPAVLSVAWYDRSRNGKDSLQLQEVVVETAEQTNDAPSNDNHTSPSAVSADRLSTSAQLNQPDGNNVIVKLQNSEPYSQASYTITYQHVVEGQVVSDALTGVFNLPTNAAAFTSESLYLGTCSTLKISCVPHQQVSELKATIMLKGPGVPDRTIEASVAQP